MKNAAIWFVFALSGIAVLATPHVSDEVPVIAVLEFENQTPDPTRDWMGGGLAETLTTQLSGLTEITVVERRLLHKVLKEIDFQRSERVDKTTAQAIGRMLGADAIVVGGYQLFDGQHMRFTARLVSVETGGIQAPVILDGTESEFHDLQIALAEALGERIKGTLANNERESLRATRPASKTAQERLSDGIYYLRQDLLEDALLQFDAALAADPSYTEASYYKGLTLQKLESWDEAIQAFKQALPRAESVRHVKWDWQVPWIGEKSRLRGRIWPMDVRKLKGDDSDEIFEAPERLIFTERVEGGTALSFVNLITKTTHRNLFPDPELHLWQAVAESGGLVTLTAGDKPENKKYGLVDQTLYVMDLERRSVLLPIKGQFCTRPLSVLAGQTLLHYNNFTKILSAFDVQSQEKLWERPGELAISRTFFPSQSETHGWLMTFVLNTDRQERFVTIRVDDGTEVWSTDLGSSTPKIFVQDQKVLELGKRIVAFDLDSGGTLFELDLRPDNSAPAILDRGVLVVSTVDRELVAVKVDGDTRDRVLWRLPEKDPVRFLRIDEGQLFAGTKNGQLLFVDMETGGLSHSVDLARRQLMIHHIDPELVIASSQKTVIAVDPQDGQKLWEYQTKVKWPKPVVSRSVVAARASRKGVVFLDIETGKPLWHQLGDRNVPAVHTTADSIFVVDEKRVTEFGVSRVPVGGVSQKEVLTELGKTHILQGNFERAAWYLDKVTHELDPGYSEARLQRGRLLAAQGKQTAAIRELLRHLDPIPTDSQPFNERLEEFRTDYGLLWRTEESEVFPRGLALAGNRLVTAGSAVGDDIVLFATDVETGIVVWRHGAERFAEARVEPETDKLIYLSGQQDDPHHLSIWVVDLQSGERRRLWETVLDKYVSRAAFSISSRRLFLQISEFDPDERRSWFHIVTLDAATGSLLWEREMRYKPHLPNYFEARGDHLAYTVAEHLSVVRADNGQTVLNVDGDLSIIPQRQARDPSHDTESRFRVATSNHTVMTVDPARPDDVGRLHLAGFDRDFALSPDLILGDTLYDSDSNRIFAIDLRSRAKTEKRLLWDLEIDSQEAVTHLYVNPDRQLFVRSTDNILRRLCPETGAVLAETPLLWDPVGLHVDNNVAYASTANGIYAMKLD